jgi:hypothetical protein
VNESEPGKGGSQQPKKNGTFEWLLAVSQRLVWPVMAAMVMVAFWMGGRVETPQDKQERIDRSLAPMGRQLEEVRQDVRFHVSTGGHAAMDQRVISIERRMEVMEQKMDILMQQVRDLHFYLIPPHSTED